jgi:hypothetical protein
MPRRSLEVNAALARRPQESIRAAKTSRVRHVADSTSRRRCVPFRNASYARGIASRARKQTQALAWQRKKHPRQNATIGVSKSEDF